MPLLAAKKRRGEQISPQLYAQRLVSSLSFRPAAIAIHDDCYMTAAMSWQVFAYWLIRRQHNAFLVPEKDLTVLRNTEAYT